METAGSRGSRGTAKGATALRELRMTSIRTIDRAVDVLNAFHHQAPERSMDELCHEVGLPRPTVYRILYTLERRGLILYNPETQKYRLGYQFLYYGDLVAHSLDLRREAEDVLLELHRQTQQTVLMSVARGDTLTYVFRKEAPEGLKVSTFEGPRRPITFGAFGCVTMAYMDTDNLEKLLAQPLPAFTPRTVTQPDQIRRRLQQIREEKVFVETGEGYVGVTGIAAPVFDARNHFVAAVGVNGPTVHLTGERLSQATAAVRNAALRISGRLGADPRRG
ncbi:IclR family transcriptional regulator [Alicyclobacillus kakegawensis]|uniref:IclR family transcriptional regulator n=1 Tax=Alicyclobacillus kakegawensis TaxID=392012 RepID=UPI0009F90AA7|nr:IclR family transcriptional regulator [Alicyclobacillus kakegawensis]